MEIEELAARAPEKILREAIDPAAGLSPFHARRLAFGLGLSGGAGRGDWSGLSTRSTAPSPNSTHL